jgi:subfamily B ATP-binding cassette protein MsbA
MGLAMFIPLLQVVGEKAATSGKHSTGQLHYLTDLIEKSGIPLTINTVLILLVVLFALKGLVKFIQTNYQVKLRHLFMKKVRYSLVNSLQDLTYTGFLKLDAGRIQNTLIGEVQRLFQSMNFYFNAAQSTVMLLTYIVLSVLANYQFALLVAIGAGLSNLLYSKMYRATKRSSLEVSKKGNEFNGFLMQAIHYFKYLKSTNTFNNFSFRLKRVIKETESLNKKMGFYSAVSISAKEPVIIVIVAAAIFLQLNLMGANLTSILLSLLFFYRALTFLVLVQNFWQTFIQNIGAIDSVTTISGEMSKMREVQRVTIFPGMCREIYIKNVVFYYGTRNVFNGLNITIPKNTTIALVGESGSGKTTVANMIAGLIHPNEGEVLIDGVSLKEYNLDSFRRRIGYISQEPVIFDDNIFNNITFWEERTEENERRFWEIVSLASLDEFVRGLPEKENTPLGINGILISGGQKQRISIARELYKNVEILILDEATSSLDSETERIIHENVEKLRGSYTMIIIAHRLSTIKSADNIYLVENGNITASGNFNKMLEHSIKFKRMVALQEF